MAKVGDPIETLNSSDKHAFEENPLDKSQTYRRVKVRNTAAEAIPVSSTDTDTTTTIFNITLGTINTEQSQALPANTKCFTIKTRNSTPLKISYTVSESGTDFIGIKPNAVYMKNAFYSSQTIFFQSPETGDVVEIEADV